MSTATATLSPPSVTPPTYHRIVSDTLVVPADPLQSIPVGLLACQRDPLLRELATTAVSCRLSQSAAVPSNGREGKKKKGTAAPTAPLLEVILHDTVIFPEGGGQPSDVGVLTSADGELWDVVEAKRHGGHAVHYVRLKADQNTEDALRLFAPGALMCMHTSQHLLSAVLEHQLKVDTLAWSLTAHPAPCYVDLSRALTAEEIAYVQAEANRLVFEGRSVHVEVEELNPGVKVKSGPSVGIPDDYTGGVKRTVVIDGVDRNPCCGTHLPSIHNLQLFLLPHAETLARATGAAVRLSFLAGPRLLDHLAATHTLLTGTAGIMSCGAPQVPERVQQVVDERKRAAKRVDDLEAELAGAIAGELVVAGAGTGGRVLRRHRTDDAPNALGFLSAISTAYVSRAAAEGEGEAASYLVVLSSSPSAQTATSTTVVLVFGSDDKRVKEVGDELKAKLNVKGGGKGPRWSGKFTGVWKDGREGTTVATILEALKL